tara:strand:+ start:309 stop:1049 length:741 start_codon:yes stop_codon:yes gene_type:complete
MNNKIKKKSPAKGITSLLGGIGKAVFGNSLAGLTTSVNPYMLAGGLIVGGGLLASRKAKKNNRKNNANLSNAQAEFEEQLQIYKDSKFQPIDPNIVDQENIFEDMEIDTSAFEMQRKAFLQQQANILQSLQTVGGTSGAAGLATALSVSAEQQAEKATMTTSQMLNRAKELRLQEQGRINQTMTNVELANAEGARQFEIDKLNTLLGVAGQKIAGVRADIAGQRQMKGQLFSGIGSLIGGIIGGRS